MVLLLWYKDISWFTLNITDLGLIMNNNMSSREWRDLLDETGYSHASLAKILGKHPTTIKDNILRYEREHGHISKLYQYALLGIMNIDPGPVPVCVLGENLTHRALATTREDVIADLGRLNIYANQYNIRKVWLVESHTNRIIRHRREKDDV